MFFVVFLLFIQFLRLSGKAETSTRMASREAEKGRREGGGGETGDLFLPKCNFLSKKWFLLIEM